MSAPSLNGGRMKRYARYSQERTYNAHSIGNDTVMPRIRHKQLDCSPGCAVEATLELIDGKWKGVILFHLLHGTMRFNALRKRLPNVTQRMLTAQLRELEQDGFVLRTVYAEVPPKVEYSLTGRGRSLEPVIMALKHWGDAHTRFGKGEDQPASVAGSLTTM
ncbi:helix-turn-helix transcriptional regulator [Gluconacetobacter sp. 1b LMG 1731]|uniref:Helix-turn-helix transcriptional regulator n=2 Tax=Acetobacteraceae TaxID=433 RepID=A0A7W4NUX9_9PROT|nr:helix-turn-helix transcriptional regulator [Gluconacetobacter dulcium]MBB2193156.1 helix-turn-helix transcriptional regulator [Gluconacetobacter dulcium]